MSKDIREHLEVSLAGILVVIRLHQTFIKPSMKRFLLSCQFSSIISSMLNNACLLLLPARTCIWCKPNIVCYSEHLKFSVSPFLLQAVLLPSSHPPIICTHLLFIGRWLPQYLLGPAGLVKCQNIVALLCCRSSLFSFIFQPCFRHNFFHNFLVLFQIFSNI